MRRTVGLKAGIGALLALGGCDVEPAPGPDGVEDRAYYIYNGWGCRTCGYKNSPVLGTFPVAEFTVGQHGFSGLALIGIDDPVTGTRHDAKFDGSALIAVTPSGSLTGNQLIGWSLVFQEPGGAELDVEIYLHEKHPDWASGEMIDTYGLSHEYGPGGGDGPEVNLCPGMSVDETSVVFLGGERYDGATKTVIPHQGEFVTAACRDHALMKLKFTGYDPNDNYGSSPEERQAGLKMFTADYCGTGQSFTKIGTPLDWQDGLGNFPAPSGFSALEARWNEFGAQCINTPRYANLGDVHSACEQEGIELEPCGGPQDDLDGQPWASYLP